MSRALLGYVAFAMVWALPLLGVAADVEVGKKAPDFTLHGVDGARYSLADHLGKRGLVLAWFPKAFTSG